jgi:hypothetical protein
MSILLTVRNLWGQALFRRLARITVNSIKTGQVVCKLKIWKPKRLYTLVATSQEHLLELPGGK